MDIVAAAQRLGVPEAEIAGVRDTADGPVMTTTDGRAYIILAETDTLAYYGEGPKNTDFPVFVPPPVEEPPAVDVDGDGVPDGTAKQVLDWVGADLDRAALALAAERNRGADARSTLVAQLEKLVG